MGRFDHDHDAEFSLEERQKTRRPRRYKVLLHNDDYTTMDFVVQVLMEHFHKTEGEATHVMLQIHHKGSGVAGIYPREIAETKMTEVMADAEANGMPLLVTVEAE